MPLESLRHAEFMANEVPGRACRTPSSNACARRRARAGTGRGILIAREVAAGIRPLVQGLQISTAAGAVDAALQVMEAATF